MNQKLEFNQLSAKAVHLTLHRDDIEIGRASGFITRRNSAYYLVTNWHVLSGRSPLTRKPRHSMGAIPNKLFISFMFAPTGKDEPERAGLQEVRLIDDNEKNLWIEHPSGSNVDVALLKLDAERLQKSDYLNLEDQPGINLIPEIGSLVYIIGYPFGKGVTTEDVHPYYSFPVWKTGHIASEPTMEYQGKPAILIDATTRGGMSGSPVFIKPIGPYRTFDNPRNLRYGDFPEKFLGIYSGRLNIQTGDDSSLSSELGLVWRPELIDEIIGSNSRDT